MHLQASDLLDRLRGRYALPEWALLQQVRNAAGYDATRTADALAVNLYPSRGLAIHGFEVKVDRRDWLRERRDPGKAEAIAAYCDAWWLVVADPAIVHEGELPPTWGLLAPRGKGLVATPPATPLPTPQPVTRSFLAALLKRATASGEPDDVAAARREGRRAGEEAAQVAHALAVQRAEDEARRWREVVADFERETGIPLGSQQYRRPELAAAVRVVFGDGYERRRQQVTGLARQLARIGEDAVRLAREAEDALREGEGGR